MSQGTKDNNKKTPQMLENMRLYIEERGLLDLGGSTITALCEHLNISRETFRRWSDDMAVVTLIENAKKIYAEKFEETLVNSLFDSAKGVTLKTKRQIKDRKGIVQQIEEEKQQAPNTGAAIFLLCNANPSKWQNRQFQQIDAKVDAKVSRYNLDALDDAELFDLADKIQDNANSTDNQG